MNALASLLWSLALLSFVGAGLGSVISWREAVIACGRLAVIFISLALALRLPWNVILHNAFDNFSINLPDGHGWLVVAGHIALVGWLIARRFFPRFTDDRARTRARRRFDRDAGGGR